ncbi:STAS domain-containing protein [Nocardia sp. NPDC051030]|uniref:STAS domain-containing protein n=1 Tax=Nocardia sp. NPDC051030 TaxID=3155162 RepID=UPI00341FA4A0
MTARSRMTATFTPFLAAQFCTVPLKLNFPAPARHHMRIPVTWEKCAYLPALPVYRRPNLAGGRFRHGHDGYPKERLRLQPSGPNSCDHTVRARIRAIPPGGPRMSAIAVVRNRVDHLVIRLDCELDAVVLPEFRRTLTRAVTGDSDTVVLDFRHTPFLSIGNAAVLACAAGAASTAGVDLRVVLGNRAVERTLDVTGVRGLLRCYPTLQAALAE